MVPDRTVDLLAERAIGEARLQALRLEHAMKDPLKLPSTGLLLVSWSVVRQSFQLAKLRSPVTGDILCHEVITSVRCASHTPTRQSSGVSSSSGIVVLQLFHLADPEAFLRFL